MSNTFKKIVQSAGFIIILAILLIVSSVIAAPAGASIFDSVIANAISDERNDSIDVLFLGDSVTYAAVSPMEIYKDHGITSYVCASNAQHPAKSALLLEQAFKNQQPKVVVLEAYSIHRKMSYDISFISKADNVFSVFKFHNRWKAIAKIPTMQFLNSEFTDDNKGYHYYTGSVGVMNPEKYYTPSIDVKRVPSENEEIFKSMLDFCKENGAQLLLLNVPHMRHWSYEKHNGIRELADKYGVPYIDMNITDEDIGIDWSEETIDMGDHLNYSGAVKTSAYIGKYLESHYSLEDHRDEADYSDWDEALERYIYSVT